MKYGEVYYILSNKVIVDSNKFKLLSAEQLAKTWEAIGSKSSVEFVDTTLSFFDKEKLIKDLIEGKDCSISLELQEIKLNAFEKSVVTSFNSIANKIKNNVNVSNSRHKFEIVPSDYKCSYNLGDKFIKNTNGTLSVSKAEKIWLGAKNIWIEFINNQDSLIRGIKIPGFYIYREYSTYSVDVYPQYITIGCQSINKLDVEQIAIHYGWDLT